MEVNYRSSNFNSLTGGQEIKILTFLFVIISLVYISLLLSLSATCSSNFQITSEFKELQAIIMKTRYIAWDGLPLKPA